MWTQPRLECRRGRPQPFLVTVSFGKEGTLRPQRRSGTECVLPTNFRVNPSQQSTRDCDQHSRTFQRLYKKSGLCPHGVKSGHRWHLIISFACHYKLRYRPVLLEANGQTSTQPISNFQRPLIFSFFFFFEIILQFSAELCTYGHEHTQFWLLLLFIPMPICKRCECSIYARYGWRYRYVSGVC